LSELIFSRCGERSRPMAAIASSCEAKKRQTTGEGDDGGERGGKEEGPCHQLHSVDSVFEGKERGAKFSLNSSISRKGGMKEEDEGKRERRATSTHSP